MSEVQKTRFNFFRPNSLLRLVMSSQLDKLTTEQKLELLNEFDELGAHTIWQADAIVEWFKKIEVDCRLDEDRKAVVFLGERIEPLQGEWGDPGIYAPRLLSVVIKKAGMELNNFGLNGRGFVHQNHLNQLAQFWGLADRYEQLQSDRFEQRQKKRSNLI